MRQLTALLILLHGPTLWAQFVGPLPMPVQRETHIPAVGYSGYMHLRNTDRGVPLDVHALLLDKQGVLWAALDRGILRCDGDLQTLYPYSQAAERGLPPALTTTMTEWTAGEIVLGTQHGLAILDPQKDRWTHVRIPLEGTDKVEANRIWRVVPLNDDTLWLMTGAGPFRFDRAHGDHQPAETPWPVGSLDTFGPPRSYASLVLDGGRSLVWVVRNGLLLADVHSRTVRRLIDRPGMEDASDGLVTAMSADANGGIWWWDRDRPGFQYADPERGHFKRYAAPSTLEKEQIRAMHVDRDHRVWLSTWSGRCVVVNPAHGVPVDLFLPGSPYFDGRKVIVRDVFGDARGRTWLATDQGVMVFLPEDPRISRIPILGTDKLDKEVVSLALSPDGSVLAGVYGGGVVVVDPANEEQRVIMGTSSGGGREDRIAVNTITTILPATTTWPTLVGTARGVFKLDATGHSLVRPPWVRDAIHNGVQSWVSSMTITDDDRLWVTTTGQGCIRFDPTSRTATHYRHTPDQGHGLPIDRLLCCLPDRDGALWIGANNGGGLCRYEPTSGRFRTIQAAAGSTASIPGVIRCLALDDEGMLWIGSHDAGVFRYSTSDATVRHYDRGDGVPGDRIFALASHPRFGTWAAGMEGIARYSEAADRFITPAYGVQWTRSPAALLLDTLRSMLYVANQDELVRIDLAATDPMVVQAPAVVRNLRINGSPVPASQAFTLTKGHDAIAMDITVLDPVMAHVTSLSYRISGAQGDWQEHTGAATVAFNDPPLGTHRLDVRTLHMDGTWSEPATLLTIRVVPPWHGTWWFRLALVALVALAGSLAFRIYLRARLRRQRIAFERQQALLAERMRIAQDMHDDLGAGLSGLKLRSEMALRMERDPQKREQLRSLAHTAGELIGGMRHIIWAMSEDQSTLEDLVVYCIGHAGRFCEENDLRIDVQRAEVWPDLMLSSEQRRNILLLVKEALHNIAKHAQATTVQLRMDWRNGLDLVVEDDGIGLANSADQGPGNGLRNMRKRVGTLNGSLVITVPKGTRITIHIPLRYTHP